SDLNAASLLGCALTSGGPGTRTKSATVSANGTKTIARRLGIRDSKGGNYRGRAFRRVIRGYHRISPATNPNRLPCGGPSAVAVSLCHPTEELAMPESWVIALGAIVLIAGSAALARAFAGRGPAVTFANEREEQLSRKLAAQLNCPLGAALEAVRRELD